MGSHPHPQPQRTHSTPAPASAPRRAAPARLRRTFGRSLSVCSSAGVVPRAHLARPPASEAVRRVWLCPTGPVRGLQEGDAHTDATLKASFRRRAEPGAEPSPPAPLLQGKRGSEMR